MEKVSGMEVGVGLASGDDICRGEKSEFVDDVPTVDLKAYSDDCSWHWGRLPSNEEPLTERKGLRGKRRRELGRRR